MKHFFYFIPLLLIGCTPTDDTEALYQDYQQRLANVVGIDPEPIEQFLPVQLPRKRDFVVPVDDIRMGLLDAYDLRQCGLFGLISERNSVLGKVQDAFHRLDYEIRFLATIQSCLDTVESKELLLDLEQIRDQKLEQFPKRYWNTIASSDAWRKQLALPAVMLPAMMPIPQSEAVALLGPTQM